MTRDAHIYLYDILVRIERIRRWTAGMSYDDFLAVDRTVAAVERAIEVISEASRRIPGDLKERHEFRRWPAVAAVGNVL